MHAQDAVQRRDLLGLGGALSGLVGGVDTAVSQVGGAVTSGLGGVVSGAGAALSQVGGDLTSGVGGITSALSPVLSSSSSSLSSSAVSSATSQTASHTSSSSTVPSTTSHSSTPSSTISSTSVTTSEFTSDGQKHTITAFVTASSSSAAAATTSASTPSKSFLQNKPLEGFVFTLVGIIALVIIFVVATFTLRRSRRRKLMNEAMSYEPTGHISYGDDIERRLTEKSRSSVSSAGSSGSGPPFGTFGFAPIDGRYRDQARILPPGQQDMMAYPLYAPRSPNPYETNDQAYANYTPRVPASVYDVHRPYPANSIPQVDMAGATPAMPPSLMPSVHPNVGPIASPPPVAARTPTPPAGPTMLPPLAVGTAQAPLVE